MVDASSYRDVCVVAGARGATVLRLSAAPPPSDMGAGQSLSAAAVCCPAAAADADDARLVLGTWQGTKATAIPRETAARHNKRMVHDEWYGSRRLERACTALNGWLNERRRSGEIIRKKISEICRGTVNSVNIIERRSRAGTSYSR